MNKRGFTLVELLVVISIIALMLAILMPSLQKAREQGRSVVCLGNIRSLSTAWMLYSEDNRGQLVGSWDGLQRSTPGNPKSATIDWVDYPQYANGKFVMPLYSGSTVEQEQNGIKKGRLWAYLTNIAVYHCPADVRSSKSAESNPAKSGGYRSYSTSGAMNGDWVLPKYAALFKKTVDIKGPSDKMVFIEMMDRRGVNQGPFWVEPGDTTYSVWINTPGIYHNKITGIGFADGHSEMRRWVSATTVKLCSQQASGSASFSRDTKEDLLYLHKIFGFKE
ncbi:MAG: type II secretion system protein [Phycisphaerales bacterium]